MGQIGLSLCDPGRAWVPLRTQDSQCQERQRPGPRQALKLLLRAGKSGGSPPPLGVPQPDLAAGLGALRLTGAASMSYKVPL